MITGIPLMRYSRITDSIYIGPQYGKAGKDALKAEGVNYGVNMRIEYDDAEHDVALDNYCYLPTIDDDAPTMEHLEQGVNFVRDAVENQGKVYIHCAGGIGRAPTMAAAYFISEGMSLDKALETIQAKRPFINIMPIQMERLVGFEKKHHQQ